MTASELRILLADLPADTPVVIWDDDSGKWADAKYTIYTDGELTICGNLS